MSGKSRRTETSKRVLYSDALAAVEARISMALVRACNKHTMMDSWYTSSVSDETVYRLVCTAIFTFYRFTPLESSKTTYSTLQCDGWRLTVTDCRGSPEWQFIGTPCKIKMTSTLPWQIASLSRGSTADRLSTLETNRAWFSYGQLAILFTSYMLSSWPMPRTMIVVGWPVTDTRRSRSASTCTPFNSLCTSLLATTTDSPNVLWLTHSS